MKEHEFKTTTQRFKIFNDEFGTIGVYLTIGFDDHGSPFYLSMDTTNADYKWVRHLMRAYTVALVYKAPLEKICADMKYHTDGPSGGTNCDLVRNASSIPDLIGRYLENKYLKLPIIEKIIEQKHPGLNPLRACSPDGRVMLDMEVGELRGLLEQGERNE